MVGLLYVIFKIPRIHPQQVLRFVTCCYCCGWTCKCVRRKESAITRLWCQSIAFLGTFEDNSAVITVLWYVTGGRWPFTPYLLESCVFGWFWNVDTGFTQERLFLCMDFTREHCIVELFGDYGFIYPRYQHLSWLWGVVGWSSCQMVTIHLLQLQLSILSCKQLGSASSPFLELWGIFSPSCRWG